MQSHYVDFSLHPNFYDPPAASPPLRHLTYQVNFDPTPELGTNIKAFVTFTEFESFSDGIVVDSEFLSATSSYVTIKITMKNNVALKALKGYVVVYNGDSSKRSILK